MRVIWDEPARAAVARLGVGIEAVWAVLFTAQHAALTIALATPLEEERSLTVAAIDLGEAMGELEWVRPDLATTGTVIDLGDTAGADVEECRSALTGLLRIGMEAVLAALQDPAGGGSTPELLALARTATLLGQAHLHVTGSLP
ncbi:MAG: hypothetical protein ABI251_13025 [Mycobacteriaceae bacterium]